MYIHSKKRVCRFVAAAGMLFFSAALFSQVSVVTIVTPPYTSNFSQYAEKLKITAISPISGSLRLAMTIKGDNGISIQTQETGSISITANTPFQVPEDYLYNFFNVNSLKISGIAPAELSEKGFPAGTYQICFDATVSGAASVTGQSCSAMFKINLAQPAMTLQPVCGSEQYKGGIQNILFSWAPSPGAPRWTQYTLRIVEIRDSLLSPAQALRSGTTPPFFEEEVSGTSYLYSPKDPPLEKGCRYVFEVIASDQETNTRFANGGRSEMCYFRYGKEDKDVLAINPALSVTAPKKKKDITKLNNKQPFPGTFYAPANISGTLYYQYAGTNLPATIGNNQGTVDVSKEPVNTQNKANVNVKGGTKTVQYGGQNLVFNKVSGNNFNAAKTGAITNVGSNMAANITLYNTDKRDPSKSFPLANMPVSLVVKYMVFDNSAGKMKMLSSYEMNSSIPAKLIKIKPDQVMASGYTDDAGNFDLTFLLTDSLGLVASNISFYTGSGEFKTSYKGSLYRVLRLMVGSNHYCSPAQDIIVQPGESGSYEDLYALVRNYGLTVSTKIDASAQNSMDGPFEGLDVYILRKNSISDVPDDEGYPVPVAKTIPDLPGFKVIAYKKTTKDGTAKFLHLVKNLNGYDKYYIYLNSVSSQVFAYNSSVKEYSNTINNEGSNIIVVPENAVYNNEYVYDDSYKVSLDLIALPPVIYGTVALSAGAGEAENNGLLAEGADVSLIRLGGYMNIVQMITKTDPQGKYSIPIPTVDGDSKYNVGASLNGYKSDRTPVNNAEPLKNGRKYEVNKMFLKTTAVFSGKIVDKEAGTGVMCHVSVQGGLSVFSSNPAPTASGFSSDFATLEQVDLTHIKEMTTALNLPQMNTIPAVVVPSSGEKSRITTISLAQSKNKPLTSVSSVANTFTTLGPSYFALPAPSGDQIIIIDPDNKTDYFSDTIKVSLKEGNNTGVIKVSRRIHRISLTVKVGGSEQISQSNPLLSSGNAKLANTSNISENAGAKNINTLNTTVAQNDKKVNTQANLQANKQLNAKNDKQLVNNLGVESMAGNADFYLVANAKVRIAGRQEYVLTDNYGVALLEFDGSDDFAIEVTPPDNRDLEPATVSFSKAASKDYLDEIISLKPATHISGLVTLNGQGVSGATVKLNYPGKQIETTTGNDGSYTLKKVPIGNNLDFEAAKDKYIGSTQTLSVTSDGKEGVNFELTQFTDIDYSKMLGFPISVTKIEKEDSKTYIYGHFISPAHNGQIDMSDDKQELTFTKLEITKGSTSGGTGLPYPVPLSSDIKVNENTAVLTLNGTFTGTLESDNSGIIIAKGSNDNSGNIKGKVSINSDISFQTNAVTFNSEKIYVMSSSSDQAPKAFNVFSSDGEKRECKFTSPPAGTGSPSDASSVTGGSGSMTTKSSSSSKSE